MHRVLLTFGDYSKTFSSYDDNTNYLITYYCYNEKHHKQDWRGMLRGDKFNIFSSMFDDFKRKKRSNQKFSEYARDRISDYLNNSSPAYSINTVEELNYYLVKNEELFKYMVSSFRCWYQDGDYRLLKTSKRSTYVNFKLYHIATGSGLSDIKMNDGSGQKHSDYISYNGHEYQYIDNTFCERMTDAIAAHTVDEMIDFLRQP